MSSTKSLFSIWLSAVPVNSHKVPVNSHQHSVNSQEPKKKMLDLYRLVGFRTEVIF